MIVPSILNLHTKRGSDAPYEIKRAKVRKHRAITIDTDKKSVKIQR